MFLSRKIRKGFTLIELLVVIAIIAVLSVVVILTLNPAELLKQARDSNRISDLATMKSAVSLYLADVNNPYIGTSSNAYFSTSATSTFSIANWGIFTATSTGATATTTRGVGGYNIATNSGWLPVNFSLISSGSPIGSLPLDPTNSAVTTITYTSGSAVGTFYGYVPASTSTTFKFVTHMESQKYGSGGGSDRQTGDGGVSTTTYEQATNLTL